ncbi:MAG TPA: DUF6691 family protein [Nannocystaceae bacterium]|nr:DUF6691 family protein [Nannocystaceae bacterium]
MIRDASALVAGLVFGLGLWVSGMTDPSRVLGFLDVAGAWDPTLVFVLGGAVGITFVTFHFVLAKRRPLLDDAFALPTSQRIDRKLLVGSAVFGVGWGISGFCPGPAIASLPTADFGVIVFVVAMIAGGLLARR